MSVSVWPNIAFHRAEPNPFPVAPSQSHTPSPEPSNANFLRSSLVRNAVSTASTRSTRRRINAWKISDVTATNIGPLIELASHSASRLPHVRAGAPSLTTIQRLASTA
jgi:CCR4-NOT transcriptional regulation complex NOT5 subunit